MFPVWISALAIVASLACPAASVTSETCPNGEYEFNGRTCCLCAAGQVLVKNCVSKPDDVECKACDGGTFNSEPNHKTSCEPCTSCHQPDAHIEMKEDCNSAMDTKCKCVPDHYCIFGDPEESCEICHPCKVCDNGTIYTACTATHNTVCSGENELNPGTIAGITIGVVAAVLVVVVVAVVVYLKSRERRPDNTNPPEEDVLLEDLQPHLPAVADTIGWGTVERLAIRSKMKAGVIESCKRNNPGDNQSQTQQLLESWMEMQGRDASKKLIEMLKEFDMKHKADEVKTILSGGRTVRSNSSV